MYYAISAMLYGMISLWPLVQVQATFGDMDNWINDGADYKVTVSTFYTVVSSYAAASTVASSGAVTTSGNAASNTATPSAAASSTAASNTAAPSAAASSAAASSAAISYAAATTNAADDCSQCSIYAQYANIYYFPSGTAAANTACLTGAASVSTAALPDGYENFQYPSVYMVIPAISAGNTCSQRGGVYTDLTLSLPPNGLSTIERPSGSTLAFDFQDLPCPPPPVATADWWLYNPSYNPGRAYQPLLSAPPEIWGLDPAWSDCVTATNNFLDPPTAMQTGNGFSNGGSRGPPRRHKRAAHAHAVPQGPVQTARSDSK